MELLIYNEKKEGCPKHFVEDCSYVTVSADNYSFYKSVALISSGLVTSVLQLFIRQMVLTLVAH